MNKKTTNWGGPEFVKVTEEQFDNFRRYFKQLSGNSFMGWYDLWDFSLKKHSKKDAYKHFDECVVARNYFETPEPEYYIRLDYIESKNYDLNTIVEKPKEPELTEEEKKMIDHICDAVDLLFIEESKIKTFDISKIEPTWGDRTVMTVEELKELIFSVEKRSCCDCWYCGNQDGYCPRYDCYLLDRLRRLTDRQWKNVIKQCEKEGDFEVSNIVGIALKKRRSSK